jgi:glyoxylase-like metal-dependent hydrolase (beta-lactamase superfamily II)
VVTAPDGLVMVNGGLQERSADLLQAIAERTGGKRVQSLFNTDWHREHTGSNETLGKAGTKIIAHENTRQYLGAEIYVDWQSGAAAAAPRAAEPEILYVGDDRGRRAGRLRHRKAHTDAAIYDLFPASNVLVAGDALSVGRYPIADYTTGGWLGGLIAANKTLLGLANAETRIVPGVGPIQTRADLQAQHDMLAAMLDRFAKMMKQGLGPDDIIAAAPTRELTKELDSKWGNPDLFVSTAYRSMWLHVRELGGIVRTASNEPTTINAKTAERAEAVLGLACGSSTERRVARRGSGHSSRPLPHRPRLPSLPSARSSTSIA